MKLESRVSSLPNSGGQAAAGLVPRGPPPHPGQRFLPKDLGAQLQTPTRVAPLPQDGGGPRPCRLSAHFRREGGQNALLVLCFGGTPASVMPETRGSWAP